MKKPLPLIEVVDLPGPRGCRGCGSPDFLIFAFRISDTDSHSIPYCRDCSVRIASYLLRSWYGLEEEETDGLADR